MRPTDIFRNKWILCLLSVIALSAGWLRMSGFPLLVAFIPLLLISRSYDSSRRSFWRMFGWTALTLGLWAALTVWWIGYATLIGPIAAVVIQMALFGGVFMLYHYVSKRAKVSIGYIILACGWIAAELFYMNGQLSFPWLTLGNGFANDVWAVQWYRWTGVYGGSLWVWACNLTLFHFIVTGAPKRMAYAAAVITVPIGISAAMYAGFLQPDKGAVKIAVVQPNIEPYTEKFETPQSVQNEIFLSLAAQAPADVDYILLPETALNDDIWEEYINNSQSVRSFRDFMSVRYPRAQLIIGATTRRQYWSEEAKSETARKSGNVWYDIYNSALAIGPGDSISVHHKSKLVVGVEAMPFPKLLKRFESLVVDLGGTTGQLGYDNSQRVFNLDRGDDSVISAAPICYESVYGEYFAGFVGKGAKVMFIITNDGWWSDTHGYKQHFAFARLRAIETGRAIARSANTGISGFISPRGDIIGETLGWDERGILTAELPLSAKKTLYARYGDYIARLSSFVFALGVFYFIAYRYRKRSHLVD